MGPAMRKRAQETVWYRSEGLGTKERESKGGGERAQGRRLEGAEGLAFDWQHLRGFGEE